MTVEELAFICNKSTKCCNDYVTYVINNQVWQFDLTEKHIAHRDGTHTYYGAYLMTEKDVVYDDDLKDYRIEGSGTKYTLLIDDKRNIISMKKARA